MHGQPWHEAGLLRWCRAIREMTHFVSTPLWRPHLVLGLWGGVGCCCLSQVLTSCVKETLEPNQRTNVSL